MTDELTIAVFDLLKTVMVTGKMRENESHMTWYMAVFIQIWNHYTVLEGRGVLT